MDKLQQQRYSMRLLDAVREAITQADPPANVKILCDGIPDAEVRGNLYLLNDVILGLIRNAIESMAGGGMVTLAAGASKTYVWLHITDSGCGIDDAVQAKLFNPFFSTKKDYGGGMGLGLWLSRLYLQTLGGDISFCSKPGQGTTFTLKIPLAEHPANTLPAKLDDVEQARTRVLIVDDSPDWRTLLSNMLRYRGFLCRVAENLNEALRAAEETDYDAYLVDIRLVDYDLQNDEGIRFVDRVLNSKPDAPVLLVSGYSRQWRHAGHYFSGYGNVLVKSKTDMEGIEAFIDSLHHIRLSA
jgi:CheY-like chemotaxis protein